MQTHEFLIDESDPEGRLTHMAELREYVDARPETSALFAPGDAVTSNHWRQTLGDQALHSLGSWPAPEDRTSQKKARWVNPGYAHAHKYSDLEETCDCGYSYGWGRIGNIDGGAIDVHDADCSERSRRHAKLRLTFRRVAWLKTAALLWIRQPVARKRLGFDYDEAASRLIRGLPETYFDWYGRGKVIAANTMMVLRDLDVPTQLIADAYGTKRQTVYTYKAHCDHEYIARRAPDSLEDGRATT
ncbi:hypothetical protein [Natronosalvus rutilus]|uniref:Uncharacterized protein n=1 Tax=Natronosalvus rutilus TaxID=2953753 RepID=A0A9E7NES4_9EURY|nr:hypothetical protein [Natronosalvus rutilus]UTF56016.1 hypothetical protein NGM29_20735 [Natronosalvus rutilus]